MSGIVGTLRCSLQRAAFAQRSNRTGKPSMSLPLHWPPAKASGDELSFGVQFVARFGNEATLLRLATQLEHAQPWAARRPSV